jgi:hypothetical protein
MSKEEFNQIKRNYKKVKDFTKLKIDLYYSNFFNDVLFEEEFELWYKQKLKFKNIIDNINENIRIYQQSKFDSGFFR